MNIGKYNKIPDGTFIPFKDMPVGPIEVGDCNVIHEGVRILVGPGGFKMGDWNVIHNHCTLGGPGPFTMGHNCWFGQEVWLDSTGGLTLGNGVRIGLRSHVWSHIASGEQVEGWLCKFSPTVLEDDVWLVGDDVHVASGLRMGARSAAMAHSTVTRDTKPDTVYAGSPAREVSFKLRHEVTLDEKFEMMTRWAREFDASAKVTSHCIFIRRGDEEIRIDKGDDAPSISYGNTYFFLKDKTYIKQLTQLERDFISFLLPNKARFIPA